LAREDTVFGQQITLDGVQLFREVNTDHQSFTPYLSNGGKFSQFTDQVVAYLRRILHQFFFLHNLQHSQCCGASKMIASKSSTQHPEPRFDGWGDGDASNRESISHALGHAVYIGLHPCMIVCIECSRTTISALHRISNKHSPVLACQCPDSL